MRKVRSILQTCNEEVVCLATRLNQLDALNGARNPEASAQEANDALVHLSTITRELEPLLEFYEAQVSKRAKKREVA